MQLPLYTLPSGSIINFQSKKWRVTETQTIFNVKNVNYLQIYIYPYKPYTHGNLSNEGLYIAANILVERIK